LTAAEKNAISERMTRLWAKRRGEGRGAKRSGPKG
jgi:hypothetical protein